MFGFRKKQEIVEEDSSLGELANYYEDVFRAIRKICEKEYKVATANQIFADMQKIHQLVIEAFKTRNTRVLDDHTKQTGG